MWKRVKTWDCLVLVAVSLVILALMFMIGGLWFSLNLREISLILMLIACFDILRALLVHCLSKKSKR